VSERDFRGWNACARGLLVTLVTLVTIAMPLALFP
jgi:hypothetical protein